jgi:hypothetical protein
MSWGIMLGKCTKFELATKTWVHKKKILQVSQLHVKKHLNYIYISLHPLPHHKRVKRDTIGVIRRLSAKLPHHKGLALAYTMENETPLVRHVIKWQGCDYTIEDNKSLNEKTRKHLKTKPKSRLM